MTESATTPSPTTASDPKFFQKFWKAPGGPGAHSNWCTGAKQAIGTSLGHSRVWFTVGQGIVNEVYCPRVDLPQVRDLGFIVADGAGFWQELKRVDDCRVELAEPGVPAVTVRHRHARFTFTQRIVTDPDRDVLLIEVTLSGDPSLGVYVLLAPHLGGTGHDNRAEAASHQGRGVLWAEQGPFGLALAAVDANQRDALRRGSAGYVGVSDGWQDFAKHDVMQWQYVQLQMKGVHC